MLDPTKLKVENLPPKKKEAAPEVSALTEEEERELADLMDQDD